MNTDSRISASEVNIDSENPNPKDPRGWPYTTYRDGIIPPWPFGKKGQMNIKQPCPDCGKMFDRYRWRMHRGPSYNERCPDMENHK